jgi:hypothetical protein
MLCPGEQTGRERPQEALAAVSELELDPVLEPEEVELDDELVEDGAEESLEPVEELDDVDSDFFSDDDSPGAPEPERLSVR